MIRAVTTTVKPTTKTTAKTTTKPKLTAFGVVLEDDPPLAAQAQSTTKRTTLKTTVKPRKTTVRYIDNDGLTYV